MEMVQVMVKAVLADREVQALADPEDLEVPDKVMVKEVRADREVLEVEEVAHARLLKYL